MFSQVKQAAACLLSVAMIGILGCFQGEGAKQAPPTQPATVLKPDVPQTPEAAVKTVVDGLRASKPVVVWDAMAPIHQADFNKMVRGLASEIDADVWNASVANLKKFVGLLETKKDFILASPLLRSQKDFKLDDVKKSWGPAVKLMRMVVDSELVDQQKMKDFDGGAFLAGSGAKLLVQLRELSKTMKEDPLKTLDDCKVSVTSLTPQSAKAVLEMAGSDDDPIEIPLAIQDGKWTSSRFSMLPYLVTSRLDPYLTTGRFRPYYTIEWKDGYLSDMKRLGTILDRLAATKTADEFQSVVSVQVLPFVVMTTAKLRAKPKPMTQVELLGYSRDKDTLMVIVSGEHFGDEPTIREMEKVFRETSGDGKGNYSGLRRFDGMTTFLVSPVKDTKEFSKKIPGVKITKIDVKRNTVTIDLPVPPEEKTTASADGADKKAAH